MTECAEKILLYVQRDAEGHVLLATTDPSACWPYQSQYVWIEKK